MNVSLKIKLGFILMALVTVIVGGVSMFIVNYLESSYGLIAVFGIATVLALALAIFLGTIISNMICKPLVFLAAFMKKASTTGDLTLSEAEKELINKFAEGKDEVSQVVDASAGFIERVTEVSNKLEVIAGGDLSVTLSRLSPSDTMGNSLRTMVGNLNNMFMEINSATSQVANGAKHIADGSQALAQGATQQASSIEELASSLSALSKKTNENAAMAKEAANLSDEIKVSAEKGSAQMGNMMQAVTEINEASGSIEKVIKVIDDIAFQTNILALNAAVEAARAGQHGKGFAVVAEEVRNLAAKSAEAAKDTGGLIENSIEKANLGLAIATETSESLQSIVEGINRNAEIIIKIEESSKEQANEILMINAGIDQVAQVVSQNSATAEESAAASEEMSGQSSLLQQLISRFKLYVRKAPGQEQSKLIKTEDTPAPKKIDMPAPKKIDMPAPKKFDIPAPKKAEALPPVRAEKAEAPLPADFRDDFNSVNDKY